MAKLYFRYGAMGSSKSANILMVRYNYEERGQYAVLLKPRTDNRDGEHEIKSRIGLEAPAEYVDILDKLIRMDVVAKEAPINDENDVSHGRKLPTVPPAFPSAAFSPVLHILLSYSSSFHSFPSL